MTTSAKPLAIGLVYRPNGSPSADRSWARALIIRHTRDARLTLVDIYELNDDRRRNADVLERLADAAVASDVRVLVTDGVRPALVGRLTDELGLTHDPAR